VESYRDKESRARQEGNVFREDREDGEKGFIRI